MYGGFALLVSSSLVRKVTAEIGGNYCEERGKCGPVDTQCA